MACFEQFMKNVAANNQVMKKVLIALLLVIAVLLSAVWPAPAWSQVNSHEDETGTIMIRSLESLRDLDFQSWQAVAYRVGEPGNPVVLRIVGYPGKVRLDHPTDLNVHSGRRDWQLADITLANPTLANDGREAAAEFDLMPLLNDLHNNRPLRMELEGVFAELPVAPYVVGEWRSVQEEPLG